MSGKIEIIEESSNGASLEINAESDALVGDRDNDVDKQTPSSSDRQRESKFCTFSYPMSVLIFSSIMYAIVPGGVKSFGVLYAALLDFYDDGAGNTAWIPGILLLLYFGMGPFSNFLGEKFTFRVVMTFGSCLVLIGCTASAFVQRMEYLYLTYGVVTGLGYGLIFTPCCTVINFYFVENRSTAYGIMTACSGIGNMVFPYFYGFLLEKFSLPGTLLVSGAVFFHVAAASLALRQPKELIEKEREERLILNSRRSESLLNRTLKPTFRRIFRLDLFKNYRYTLFVLAICFQSGNTTASKIVLAGQIRSLGFESSVMMLSVCLFGISEIIGRLFLGWFADRNILSRIQIFVCCAFLCAVSSFLMKYFPYERAMFAYAVVIGAFSGSIWGLNSVILLDCVGPKDLPPALGVLMMCCGLFICICQPVAGWLEDRTGSWDASFIYVGVLSTITVLLCTTEQLLECIWCCRFIRNTKQTDAILIPMAV